jgi:predicted nucleic acid-binding protein
MAQNGEGLKMKRREKSATLSSVLIDTPVWQDYFQKEERTFQEVNALMDTGRVCCLDLIVAELFYAGETEEEMKVLQDFTRIFPVLRESPGDWVEAARLAFKLRQRGKKLPLRDCYVAFMAQSHGVFLYTTNQSLRRARRAMEIGLEFFPERRISE